MDFSIFNVLSVLFYSLPQQNYRCYSPESNGTYSASNLYPVFLSTYIHITDADASRILHFTGIKFSKVFKKIFGGTKFENY